MHSHASYRSPYCYPSCSLVASSRAMWPPRSSMGASYNPSIMSIRPLLCSRSKRLTFCTVSLCLRSLPLAHSFHRMRRRALHSSCLSCPESIAFSGSSSPSTCTAGRRAMTQTLSTDARPSTDSSKIATEPSYHSPRLGPSNHLS